MWKKIVNPETGRKVSVNGNIGKKILKNYLHQLGGASFASNASSGSNSSSSLGNGIILCAIGGPTEERAKRAALAKQIFPSLNGHYYLTLGGTATNNFMQAVPGEVAFYPIPASQAPQFVAAPTNSPAEPVDAITTSSNDTVLVIGHTSFDPDIAVAMLSGINAGASVFLQGPGFNIGLASGNGTTDVRSFGESLTTFKSRVSNTTSFAAPACPDFTLSQWSPLIRLYAQEPSILELHQYGVAAFFTSRFDGAFHRQFSLVNLDDSGKKQFEIAVANGILTQLQNDNSQIAGQIKDIAQGIVTTLSQQTDSYFQYETGKEDNWKAVYKLWYNFNAGTFPQLMPVLSQIIMNTIISALPSATIKEYDGFVCHNMLRANIPIENPEKGEKLPPVDAQTHYQFLNIVLNSSANINKKARDYILSLARALQNILTRGNLIIVHDLGLDPMVDDFIAIKIIDYLKRVLDSYQGL